MKYVIHAYEQSYGALHGIETCLAIEADEYSDVVDMACEASREVMGSYHFIEEALREQACFYCGVDEYDEEDEDLERAYEDAVEENIDFAKSVARPFSKFYDKQLNALLDLGCPKLKINKSSVDYLLKNYSNKYYSDDLIARVKYILKNRLDYYEGWCFVYV